MFALINNNHPTFYIETSKFRAPLLDAREHLVNASYPSCMHLVARSNYSIVEVK